MGFLGDTLVDLMSSKLLVPQVCIKQRQKDLRLCIVWTFQHKEQKDAKLCTLFQLLGFEDSAGTLTEIGLLVSLCAS